MIRAAAEARQARGGVRRRDAAVPAGRAAHRLGAGEGRHRHHGHHRQHGRRDDAARAASTWWSSAPTASPPTATWPTRSAPTAWRCWPRSTASRSTSPRRSRPSISTTPDGSGIPIEERNDREVTHVGAARLTPEGARIRNPAFDVTPGALRHGHRHRAAASRAPPYDESLAALIARRVARSQPLNRDRMMILGIETSCDETAAAVVEETGDAGAAVARPLERRRVAGRRSTASGAASCPSCPRASTSATSAAWSSSALERRRRRLARYDAIAVTQGPGLVGSLLVGSALRQVAGLGARRAARAGAPPGRPHRVAGPRRRRDAAAGGGAGRVGRAHQPLPRAARRASTSGSAARATTPRARPTTRWPSCSAWAIPGGPVIDRLAGRGQRPRGGAAADAAHPRRTATRPHLPGRRDFSFSGLKTSVAPPRRAAARGARPGRGRAAAATPTSRDLCASFQRVVVETLLDRAVRRGARRGRAHRWASPAACRPTAGCARDALARGAARRPAGVRPAAGALHRQRRDDRRRRAARVSRRRRGDWASTRTPRCR